VITLFSMCYGVTIDGNRSRPLRLFLPSISAYNNEAESQWFLSEYRPRHSPSVRVFYFDLAVRSVRQRLSLADGSKARANPFDHGSI
jgi:hypothetical protein